MTPTSECQPRVDCVEGTLKTRKTCHDRDELWALLSSRARVHHARDASGSRLVGHGDQRRAADRDLTVLRPVDGLRVLLLRLVLADRAGHADEGLVERALDGDVEAVHVDEADALLLGHFF